MKVICKQSTAKNLDLKEVHDISSKDYDYQLDVGKEYIVMGMVIYKETNCLYYLISDHWWPFWYPYMLFEITDSSIPFNWYIKIFNESEHPYINVMIGFDELCNDIKFHDNLAEREDDALITYFKRTEDMKHELDEKRYLK